jgi:hypothetical protein
VRVTLKGSLGPVTSAVVEGSIVLSTYTALALWLLHPLFAAPTQSVAVLIGGGPANADVNLNMWILAWDWHALTTHPLGLFNGNVFYPAPLALAGSEHMLGHLPIFAPLYALSGNPVFASQMDLLSGFVLSAAGLYALLRHWHAPGLAALFAGFVYGFCPIRVMDTTHIQHSAGQYLPIALLFLDRTLVKGTWRAAGALALCLLLQMLCSYYLAYMTVTAVSGYALGVLWATRGRLHPRGVLLAVAAAILAGAAVGLLSLPYLRLKQVGVLPGYESTGFLRFLSSGVWKNFLYPPVALQAWGARLDHGASTYVGFVPLFLALVGVCVPQRNCAGPRRWARSAALGAAAACYVMALGPELTVGNWVLPLPYKIGMRVIPGFSSMRAPTRFGLMLMCGFAALSGLGLARLIALVPQGRWGTVLATAIVIVLGTATAAEYGLLQSHPSVRQVAVGAKLPGVYRALQQEQPGPVLEIPAGWNDDRLVARSTMLPLDVDGTLNESEYMFYSTFHWHPLLNGYSGYWPPTYFPVLALARVLPDPRATQVLVRMTGVRYFVVHLARLSPAQRERWEAAPGLRRVGTYGSDVLFEVEERSQPDLLADVLDWGPRSRTLLGTALTSVLPARAAQAELALVVPAGATAVAGGSFDVEVLVTNRSSATWPALALWDDHLVMVGFQWQDETGEVIVSQPAGARLPYDLRPGESVRVPLVARPPRPGTLRLVVALSQDGVWFPDVVMSEFRVLPPGAGEFAAPR